MTAPAAPDERPAAPADLEACLSRIAAGDQAALAELYDATNRLVFAMAVRILGDRDLAEDVIVEVYGQAWRTRTRTIGGAASRRRGS